MKGSTGKIFSAGMYPAGYIFHSIPKICVFAVSKSLLPETLSMLDEKKCMAEVLFTIGCWVISHMT